MVWKSVGKAKHERYSEVGCRVLQYSCPLYTECYSTAVLCTQNNGTRQGEEKRGEKRKEIDKEMKVEGNGARQMKKESNA